MKKPGDNLCETAAAVKQRRFFRQKPGIRQGIFVHLLLFAAMLLLILWLFEIVLLDDFYKMQKRDALRASSQSIADNIGNENLNLLVDRIAEQSDICVTIVDEDFHEKLRAESGHGCVIHHMNRGDMRRIAGEMENSAKETALLTIPLGGFRNRDYDARKFSGPVPPSDDGDAQSMILIRSAQTPDGETCYVFLNALITPVTSTVQTIRNELYFISAMMILLSFALSLVLSRRITQPLVETTQAARELSRGRYTPVKRAGYREVEQLNCQLSQAAKELHRVEKMQQELIANISHDLRTPLTLIEGYAEAMRDLPGENSSENMQVIIDETQRLSTLVNAVLDLNKARQQTDIQATRYNLTQDIRQTIACYGKLMEQDGYHIVFEPSEEVFVTADPVKMQQVICNLLNNAITYTGADRTVRVEQNVANGQVRIAVRDSGEGIAKEDLPFIWDRYFRGSKPHKRAAVGSGLGLNIVKEILENHHLRYGVESELGHGSVFWFEMPLT